MATGQFVVLACLVASTAWTVFGLLAVIRLPSRSIRRRAAPSGKCTGVSVLKPLCGADPGLEANLESFFRQSYGSYEVVLGVVNARDPAIPVVNRLKARYPHVPCQLVVHSGGGGMNPKVANLRGMIPSARYDAALISDSNIRAPQNYLVDAMRVFTSSSDVGIVTHLFAGTGEASLGAALENVQLNGFCAAGATLPTTLGDPAVVGKSMLFSRSRFEHLGGFERVANVLAEDFIIGKMFKHAGHSVKLGTVTIENVTSTMTVADFLARHLRWSMLRWRLRPAAYALEPLTSPLFLLAFALPAFGSWAVAWAVTMLWLRDVGGWIALRGSVRAWIPLVLAPLREACVLFVWTRALFKRHIT